MHGTIDDSVGICGQSVGTEPVSPSQLGAKIDPELAIHMEPGTGIEPVTS